MPIAQVRLRVNHVPDEQGRCRATFSRERKVKIEVPPVISELNGRACRLYTKGVTGRLTGLPFVVGLSGWPC